jgi:hypothetical protein
VAQLIQAKRLTQRGRTIGVQKELTVDAADDQYEQVADHVAWQMMNMPATGDANAIQRALVPEEDEDDDTEKLIQAKFFTETRKEPLERQPETEKEESTNKLPPDVGAHMEASFSQGSRTDSPVALAHTRGPDIPLTPAQFDSHTQVGMELLDHAQRSDRRVGTTGDVRALPLNDDPALEQEADDLAIKAAQGKTVGGVAAASSSDGGYLAQMNADPSESSGEVPESLAGDSETPAATVQLKVAGRQIQAHAAQRSIQRQARTKSTHVPYQVHVNHPMTQEEFRVAAMRQIFGGVLKNIEWRNSKDSYVPENSPYTVLVSTRLLKQQRGLASKDRGISMGADGGVAGAEERAKTFHAEPESDAKSALMKEIDRRYFEAVGDKTETKIKAGEKGKAELWRMIRDEVLFQHEYIANLPPQVKQLIKVSIKGKDLTPADYDKLFAIAKKIEKMPAGHVSDYASKITGATTDLDVFEMSLDKYSAQMAERGRQGEEREKVQTKLMGVEEVYKKYQLYKSLLMSGLMGGVVAGPLGGAGAGIVIARKAEKMRKELESELQAHGFAGIAEFEAFINKFERAFEQEAVNITNDLLQQYAGKLYRESERYKNPAEVAALHQKLGGIRTQFREVEANAKIWNDYMKASEQSRIAGQAHLRPKIGPTEAEAARKKAEEAKAAAQSQVQGMSSDHPIFQEEGLPLDKRIDKAALAKASESELGGLLQGHLNNRMKDVGEARAEIEGKPEVIYKMDKLMPQFYARMGIRPDSIHDMIIRDKMKEDAILKLVKGIAFAIVAIALAVVTFGAATPAILAAGAGIVGAGLGIYQAYESYQEYVQEKNLADVGFATDPSVIWLVIAVAGAALDMAAAVKAMKALGPAAKALEAGGDLAEFNKAVRALEEAKEIESRIARAAEKAASARKSLAESTKELGKALGKAYSLPGPFTDPDVYKALVKMARDAIKTKVYDAAKFLEEIRLARVNAKLGELTPEELAKVKQAWEEAKVLEALETVRYERLLKQIPDAARLDALIAQAGDAAKLERLFAQVKDTKLLAALLEHTEPGTAAGMIRGWMKEGTKGAAKMNQFLERLAAGGKELAETSAVGAKAIIIDSNTAIALLKDADPALRATLQPGEKAWVAYIKSLPAGTELRVANVTVGEIRGGVVTVKGIPLTVSRESADYQKVLAALAKEKVGTGAGFADRAVIADALFAKVEAGVIPKLVTGDKNMVKNLARMATIDVVKAGGYPGLAKTYGSSGFQVVIEGRPLLVVPLPVP